MDKKVEIIEEFPLRGSFLCPKCGKKLTASEIFIDHLKKFAPEPAVKKLYTTLILESYSNNTNAAKDEKGELLTQINNYEKRLSNARELLVTSQIDADDYQKIKTEYRQILNRLELQLSNVYDDKYSIEGLLNMGIERLMEINLAYTNTNLSEARELIGLIYPENFTFKNNQFQTARVNEIATSIYILTMNFRLKKTGQKMIFIFCPIE